MLKKPYFGIEDQKKQGLVFGVLLLATAFLLAVLPGGWRLLSLLTLVPTIKLAVDAILEIIMAVRQ